MSKARGTPWSAVLIGALLSIAVWSILVKTDWVIPVMGELSQYSPGVGPAAGLLVIVAMVGWLIVGGDR